MTLYGILALIYVWIRIEYRKSTIWTDDGWIAWTTAIVMVTGSVILAPIIMFMDMVNWCFDVNQSWED